MLVLALTAVTLLVAAVIFISFLPELRARHIPAHEINRAVDGMERGFGDEAASVAEQRMTRAHAQFDISGAAYWSRVHRLIKKREKARAKAEARGPTLPSLRGADEQE